MDTMDKVRLVIDACAYLYLCFKGVFIILSSAAILDDVHV